jgi:hypothetical protein
LPIRIAEVLRLRAVKTLCYPIDAWRFAQDDGFARGLKHI